jgi:hypothetical protein
MVLPRFSVGVDDRSAAVVTAAGRTDGVRVTHHR